MSNSHNITRMLHQCRDGDDPGAAFDALIPIVYDDLKIVARQQLRRLRPGQTLNTTALVNDSYSKLKASADLDWHDRQHFYAIAARAMRQVIVDYARNLSAVKNRHIAAPLDVESVPGNASERADQVMYVDQLLDKLEKIGPDLVRVFECKYFAGFTFIEITSILGISERTAQRRWNEACAWLRELADGDFN